MAGVRRELALTPERLALGEQGRPDGHQGAGGIRGAEHAREHQGEHAAANEHLEQQVERLLLGCPVLDDLGHVLVALGRLRGHAQDPQGIAICVHRAHIAANGPRGLGTVEAGQAVRQVHVRTGVLVVIVHEHGEGTRGPAAEAQGEGRRPGPAPLDPLHDGLGALIELADALVGQRARDCGVDGHTEQQQHRERGTATEQHQAPSDAPDELGVTCAFRVNANATGRSAEARCVPVRRPVRHR